MSYKGIIKNKVVVLEKGVSLPEGTHVIVIPEAEQEIQESNNPSAWDILAEFTGAIEGPEAWSSEHDHYLYGTPKRRKRSDS